MDRSRTCIYCNLVFVHTKQGRIPTLCSNCRSNIKFCSACDKYKSIEYFSNSKGRYDGLNSRCKSCCSSYNKRTAKDRAKSSLDWKKRNFYKTALNRIRGRCKSTGVIFNLTLEDLPELPERCPVFKIPLFSKYGKSGGHEGSPSLDRIVPSLGYVPGNIQWISKKANVAKQDLSYQDLILLGDWAAGELNNNRPYYEEDDHLW